MESSSTVARVAVAALVNGVVSWPDKVADVPRQRQDNFDAGKGYFELEVDD